MKIYSMEQMREEAAIFVETSMSVNGLFCAGYIGNYQMVFVNPVVENDGSWLYLWYLWDSESGAWGHKIAKKLQPDIYQDYDGNIHEFPDEKILILGEVKNVMQLDLTFD